MPAIAPTSPSSPSIARPFPRLLIESELFGHKPGAFTGAAREGGVGRILQANGGTLFLDEIGDMPVALQTRLLNVIEDREVMPLGGSKVVSVDVRVISATQHHPLELIAKGQFREDLYYRLNGITVRLPPLRQRSDSAELIEKLLRSEANDAAIEHRAGAAASAWCTTAGPATCASCATCCAPCWLCAPARV